MVTKKDKVSIYLPGQLKDALIKLAAQDKRSLSVFIEVLVLEALANRGITPQLENNEEGEDV
jgi:hypothetical protein